MTLAFLRHDWNAPPTPTLLALSARLHAPSPHARQHSISHACHDASDFHQMRTARSHDSHARRYATPVLSRHPSTASVTHCSPPHCPHHCPDRSDVPRPSALNLTTPLRHIPTPSDTCLQSNSMHALRSTRRPPTPRIGSVAFRTFAIGRRILMSSSSDRRYRARYGAPCLFLHSLMGRSVILCTFWQTAHNTFVVTDHVGHLNLCKFGFVYEAQVPTQPQIYRV